VIIGAFSVFGKTAVTRNVTLVKVLHTAGQTPPGNAATIERALNNFGFGQAFINFNIVEMDTLDLNVEYAARTSSFQDITNGPGIIDGLYKAHVGQLGNVNFYAFGPNNRYYIFVTDYEISDLTTGEQLTGHGSHDKNVLLLFKGHDDDTSIHEMGHTCGLFHCYRDPADLAVRPPQDDLEKYSTDNYMDYEKGSGSTGKRNHWFIHQLQTIQ
jgi:hypothetical protein